MRVRLRSVRLSELIKACVLACSLIPCSEQCAATAGGGTVIVTTTAEPTLTTTVVVATTTTAATATTTTVAGETTTTAETTTTTTTTTTAAPAACTQCSLDQVERLTDGPGSKPFTTDTIDTSSGCAVRTSVCDGNEPDSDVIIAYNMDAIGVDEGPTQVISTLTCNDQMQWVKNVMGQLIVITSFECQST